MAPGLSSALSCISCRPGYFSTASGNIAPTSHAFGTCADGQPVMVESVARIERSAQIPGP